MSDVVHMREGDVVVTASKDPELAAVTPKAQNPDRERTVSCVAYLLAVSSIAGRKSVSVGPYTWCGATAHVNSSPPLPFAPLERSTACSPKAFVRAYLLHWAQLQQSQGQQNQVRALGTGLPTRSTAVAHSCENDDGYGISSSVCPVTSPP